LDSWGSDGENDGEFSDLDGIVVDGSGNVYTTDSTLYEMSRVQKFDTNGDHVATWGALGTGNSQFNIALKMAIYDNHLFVVDSGNGRVQELSLTGTYVSSFGLYGGLETKPIGVLSDGQG